jgi:hypothetical protein
LLVIPAKAEALYNSEAGQSSFNMAREALNIDFCVLRTAYFTGSRPSPE